jgi:hypothetical protein
METKNIMRCWEKKKEGVSVEHVAFKFCASCKENKSILCFGKDRRSKDGFRGCCKDCRKAEMSTPEQKEMAKKRRKRYDNSEHGKAMKAEYSRTETARILSRARNKKYSSKPDVFERRKAYERDRFSNNINYRLISNLRSRLYGALKGTTKSDHTMRLLGCDVSQLWEHLESMFKEGMTKENYGRWHVDHIKPCYSFDMSDPDQQKQCFHYSNLQPLWAEDNLIKGTRTTSNSKDLYENNF